MSPSNCNIVQLFARPSRLDPVHAPATGEAVRPLTLLPLTVNCQGHNPVPRVESDFVSGLIACASEGYN